MYAALSALIIVNETSDYRFEQFCLTIVGKHEGITYVPTSQSWDLGRDARSTNRAKGSHSNILCATLNDNVDAKAEADMLRLTALASPDRIVFCSSQKLSEHRIDEITAIIRRHTPGGSVLVLGSIQLSEMAANNRPVFERFYRAELQEVRNTIFSENPGGAASNGLRLALLTFGSEEGSGLRQDVLHATLLDRLNEHTPQSVNEICQAFSLDLGLSKTLPDSFLLHALMQAQADGDVEKTTIGWQLSAAGLQKQKDLPLEGVQHLLEGRRIVRTSLEKLLRQKYTDSQYSSIWSGLVDTLAGIFHANGLEIVKAVDQLLASDGTSDRPVDLKKLLEGGMRRTAAVINTSELRDTTYTALLDLFTERQGEGFDWLTKVAERFVTLCAIGLEATSSEAIQETLISQRVVLDSDIILSYLCKAEPDHAASRDLLTAWLEIGGKILVSPVVLEEVAHNAWISDNDFRGTESFLGRLQYQELTRYIKSPFVRTFHTLNAPAPQWQFYIGQYRGNSSGDYSKILALLRQRLKVEVLPAAFDESLKDRIISFIRQLPKSINSDAEHIEDMTYKVERDGRLLASIASARLNNEASGNDSPIVLLSSSVILRRVELTFSTELGHSHLVFNKRAFSYLLASVPQSTLGADTLRRALFEFGSHGRLRSHDRRALRIIRSTGIIDMPWAERTMLRQHLSKAIKTESERRGLSRRKIQDQISSSAVPEMTAAILVETIKNMAIPTSVQKELVASKRRIAELESELAATAGIAKRDRLSAARAAAQR